MLSIDCMILIAIWTYPGTIALRHMTLIFGFFLSFLILVKHKKAVFSFRNWPFFLLLFIFPWLLIHLMLFSQEPVLQILELKSVWVRIFLATVVGFSFGLVTYQPRYQSCKQRMSSIRFFKLNLILIFSCFSFPFIAFAIRYLYEIYLTGDLIHHNFYRFPFKSKTPFIVFSAVFLPLCFILLLNFFESGRFKKWVFPALLGIFLCLLSIYFAGTKNGILIFGLNLIIFSTIFLIKKTSGKKIIPTLLVLMLMTLSGYLILQHTKQNVAWQYLISDVKIGFDIENQSYWKERNEKSALPLNDNGHPVNTSTYERTAWFAAGLNLLAQNPLGYGLLHHSFGSFAKSRWPLFSNPIGNVRGATHSGWLDLALGIGIPGLIIVVIPLFVAWLRLRPHNDIWSFYGTWAIPIIFLSYLISEANEAHFTEFLFFIIAFFCGLGLRYPFNACIKSSMK